MSEECVYKKKSMQQSCNGKPKSFIKHPYFEIAGTVYYPRPKIPIQTIEFFVLLYISTLTTYSDILILSFCTVLTVVQHEMYGFPRNDMERSLVLQHHYEQERQRAILVDRTMSTY